MGQSYTVRMYLKQRLNLSVDDCSLPKNTPEARRKCFLLENSSKDAGIHTIIKRFLPVTPVINAF
jgi:hypothetical protein